MKGGNDMNCLECSLAFSSGKDLSNHIKKDHGLSGEEYTAAHFHSGLRPACLSCGSPTRYSAFSFKKYCAECSEVASREGGKAGGKSPAWNKGKTAAEDLRIANQAIKRMGQGNPFFGKRHDAVSLAKMRSSRRISKESFYSRIMLRTDIKTSPDYQAFVSRNEKNIDCECSSCKKQFTTSLSYIERDFKCPHCHARIPSFKGREHSRDSIDQLKKSSLINAEEFSSRIASRVNEFELLTLYDDYFSRQKQYLKFRCKSCDTVSEKTLQAFERGSLCRKCFPQSSSRAELEIGDYIESLGVSVSRNNRTIIKPKEIDIFVDSKHAGFEYDGLYWHSEMNKLSPSYQIDKTRACLAAGVSLFRVYSDQWERKRDIVTSMIRSRLGLIERRIPARKCSVIEIDQKASRDFFERNHLYGNSPARQSFALVYDGKIISVVSMRTPRQRKYRQEGFVEVCRFATELNHIVVGGFSKIFSRIRDWARMQGFKKILSYADLDTGTGDVYSKSGFTLVGETGHSYWYTDGVNRFDRFKFRASRGKSEKEVASDAGVYRVYGAGSRIYSADV